MASENMQQDPLAVSSIFSVEGIVALVTGGGTGIGLTITKALVQNGAKKVYIAGRRLDKLQAATNSLGSRVQPICCDVSCKEDVCKAEAFVRQDAGYLNLLVCNAGIAGPHPGDITPDMTLEEFVERNWEGIDPVDYTNTFAVNTTGVWMMAVAFLPLLDLGNKRGNVETSSQVVVTSSISAFIKPMFFGGSAYALSKAAATLLMKQLSIHLPQWGIR